MQFKPSENVSECPCLALPIAVTRIDSDGRVGRPVSINKGYSHDLCIPRSSSNVAVAISVAPVSYPESQSKPDCGSKFRISWPKFYLPSLFLPKCLSVTAMASELGPPSSLPWPKSPLSMTIEPLNLSLAYGATYVPLPSIPISHLAYFPQFPPSPNPVTHPESLSLVSHSDSFPPLERSGPSSSMSVIPSHPSPVFADESHPSIGCQN
ncbi:hypothetical protein Nepgr_004023 [Nepenthes gracilis]|uniref:Uncharacterized protein n=1 Tax=Nepenthes gracilis TaxID=150966 RepID=A0AAD3S0Q4_NEPGR|nr:hypothetical protein Nepgr_004023 [Nepenthes gracilis]